MTKEVIDSLHEVLKNNICTLKRTSTDTTNKVAMCESKMIVVNFDNIPKEYVKDRDWDGVPKSNDALYVDVHGKWYFIEFKNGSIRKDDIYRKLYDSIIMLVDWKIFPDFEFVRNNVKYILVYNGEKYSKIQESKARSQNYDYIMKLANQEEKLFEIDRFEKYLFDETHTYTAVSFEKKFVRIKEEEEANG